MNLDELIKQAIEAGASDIHFTVGAEPTMRLHGRLTQLNNTILTNEDTVRFTKHILNEKQIAHLLEVGEVDCAYEVDNGYRLQVNYLHKSKQASLLVP